jgi:hypothetical protein
LLANCSAHPLIEDVTRTTTYAVVEKIRCEAKRAVIEHGRRFGDESAIAYEFTFHIRETNDATGDVTWTLPFVNGGNFFALTASAGSNLKRETTRNFTIFDTFGDLRKTNCNPEALEKNWIYPIAGDVGIYEVVKTFAQLHSVENPVKDEVFSFHDTLTFTTNLGAGVSPTLVLSEVTNKFRVTGASADLKSRRFDEHTLVIGLSAGAQTTTTIARRSPSGIRSFIAMAPNTTISNQSVLSTTLLQIGSSLQKRALHELDRARILALQARAQNLVVGP